MISSSELIRAVRGPIILITIGTLFALDHFTPYGFHQTWPVILIVVGVLTLWRARHRRRLRARRRRRAA